MGYLALSEGVACAFGPLLGAVVYAWLGYVNTFYFFTGYIGVLGFGSNLMMPSRLNQRASDDDEEEENVDGDQNQDKDEYGIAYCDILKNRKSAAALVANVLGMCCCAFIDPTLSVVLEGLGMKQLGIGGEFAGMGISWGFGSTMAGYLCSKMTRKLVM